MNHMSRRLFLEHVKSFNSWLFSVHGAGGGVCMDKLRVAVLGATGMVGQRFVKLLSDHPRFELEVLAASSRSAGKRYA